MLTKYRRIPTIGQLLRHPARCGWLHGLLILLALPAGARADVKLPALFSDNAVLQRDMKVPVWGWAAPGEKVTVTRVDGLRLTVEKQGR